MVKIKVIYGAPASGKTTYVKEHISPNDLMYDFDDIMMCLSGLPYQKTNPHLIDYVVAIRELIINKLRYEKNIANVYIITTFISKSLKDSLNGMNVEYVRMDASIKECIERVRQSNRPDKEDVIQTIKRWFNKYREETTAEGYKTEEEKRRFYKSSGWNKLRQAALKRDNHECQECKRQGRVHVDSIKEEGKRKSIELNVHHIQEIEHYPEMAMELDNLETLCLNCHNRMHGRVFNNERKSTWNDEKW